MPERKQLDTLEKMIQISELIEQGKQSENIQVETMIYYKDFVFQGSNLAEIDIFIAKVQNMLDQTNTYEIYSGKTNTLIATVDIQGKIHFMPEYIESLKEIDGNFAEMLHLENLDFQLPKELAKEDIVLTKEERIHMSSKKDQPTQDEKKAKEEKQLDENKGEKSLEEEQKETIARLKKVPSHNILMIRENSNLYKDHPNLEKNLYFYRDSQGIVKAEYIDINGKSQPSKYFEASTTALSQENISVGNNGKAVTKEVPHQVMKTKGLNHVDKDIKDIRMNIKIDQYGYLDIEEARQGSNGEWLAHDVEVQGRNYNSYTVNRTTSIHTRNADPDKQTQAYEKTTQTGLKENGIEYSEMYLIQHPNEFIQKLIEEGYQKPEAIQIFNYIVGKEKLDLEEAKQKVNKEIKQEKLKEDKGREKQSEDERTPWGDAENRKNRR